MNHHLRHLAQTRRTAIHDGSAALALRALSIPAGLATSILLARSLGPTGYGLYAQFFSLAGLMALLAQHGMPTLLTREIALARKRDDSQAARTVLHWSLRRSLLFAALICVTVAFVYALLVHRDLLRTDRHALIALVLALCMVPTIAMLRNAAGALAGLHRMALGQMPVLLAVPVLFLLALGMSTWLGFNGIVTTLAARALAEFLGMILALCLLFRYLPGRCAPPDKPQIKAWEAALIPLSLVMIAMTLNHHIDVQMLGAIAGAQELGIYRVAGQIAIVPMVVTHIAAGLTAPRVAAAHAANRLSGLRPMLSLGARIMMAASCLFALAFALLGQPAMEWVFGLEFARSHSPALILSLGIVLVTAFGAAPTVLNMTGLERLTARHALLSSAANIGLNALLIPLYGAQGAAWATLVSLLILYGLSWSAVKQRLGIRCDALPNPKPLKP